MSRHAANRDRRGIHRRTKKMTSARISSHFAELLDFLRDVLAWVEDRLGRYLLSEIDLNCGFADHSHFSRECRGSSDATLASIASTMSRSSGRPASSSRRRRSAPMATRKRRRAQRFSGRLPFPNRPFQSAVGQPMNTSISSPTSGCETVAVTKHGGRAYVQVRVRPALSERWNRAGIRGGVIDGHDRRSVCLHEVESTSARSRARLGEVGDEQSFPSQI